MPQGIFHRRQAISHAAGVFHPFRQERIFIKKGDVAKTNSLATSPFFLWFYSSVYFLLHFFNGNISG
jgi:hypothetical protein